MMFRLMLLGMIVAVTLQPAVAQPRAEVVAPPAQIASLTETDAANAPLFYVIDDDAVLYRGADFEAPYLRLGFREKVYVVERGVGWRKVRTAGGTVGYVNPALLSESWLRISKGEATLYAYRGTELVAMVPVDFGNNVFADKEQRGSRLDPDHWRTPEGVFYVARKNDDSQYYKAFVLNYPTAEDAERGRRAGLISEDEYEAIVRAEEEFDLPPMHTALGGWIEIHGNGTGNRVNWTQGCVAVTDSVMDDLWNWVEVGTPVLIEP